MKLFPEGEWLISGVNPGAVEMWGGTCGGS
jgi:hypothetical protein